MKHSRRKSFSAASVSHSQSRHRRRRSSVSTESSSQNSETQSSDGTPQSREKESYSSTDAVAHSDEEYYDGEEEHDDEDDASSPALSTESSNRTAVNEGRLRVCETAYVNVAPLPVFHGRSGECPVAHLARFARVCRANNAATPDAIARIFPVTLEDEAALWYELEVEPRVQASVPTWEETKAAFKLAFQRPDFIEQRRSELLAIMQSDDESVYGYYLRMQWILKRWPEHGLPELMLKGIFLDGLRENFRDWIIPQRPNTLQEALKMAMVWEQAEVTKAARRKKEAVLKRCGFCGGDRHEERLCEVKKKLRELWLSTAGLKKSFKDGVHGAVAGAGVGKGNIRSLSLTTNIMRRQGEGLMKGTDDNYLASNSDDQCMCWKHQCWKRRNSFLLKKEED